MQVRGSLRAIQTSYKGCRFRSRAEARWAVFLDTLGVEWTYEVEGFDLDRLWYLPDFWLPKLNTWLEVKGVTPTALEIRKAQRLAESSHSKVLVLSGQPWIGEHNITLVSSDGYGVEDHLIWGEINGSLCLEYPDGIRLEMQTPHFVRHVGLEYRKDIEFEGSALQRAFVEARGARFENLKEEFDKVLRSFEFLIEYGFGRAEIPPKFKSLEDLFFELNLKPLSWRGHVFALVPATADEVGCLIVRESDRRWGWFEIDWHHFMRKAPIPNRLPDDIDKEEYRELTSLVTRKVRKDPLAFFKSLGVENAISWRNLAIAFFEKNDWLELVVMRITDGNWWSLPFDEEMFERI